MRTLLIGVLTAAQGLVGALILASLALAPDESDLQDRELRLIPLTDVDAISWSRRIAVFGGTLGLAVVTRSLFERLGINADSATAAQYIFVIALALVALEAIWRGYRSIG